MKRKLSSIKNQVKSLEKSINDEIKETITQVEKNKSDLNIKLRIKSIKDKIDQLKQLNARLDLKPIDDAVQYLKTVPVHPRVRLAHLMRLFNQNIENSTKNENVPLIKKSRDDDIDDIIILGQTPSHPRDRLARNTRLQLQQAAEDAAAETERRDKVEILGQTPSHPRDTFGWNSRLQLQQAADKAAAEIERRDEVEILGQTPSHPRDRFARNSRLQLQQAADKAAAEIEQRDEPAFIKITPSHPRDRLRSNARTINQKAAKQAAAEIENRLQKKISKIKQPKVYLEPAVMRELPNFNTKIVVTETSLIGRENQIYNSIIKQLPPDNDKYYIVYSEQHDAYIVRKE